PTMSSDPPTSSVVATRPALKDGQGMPSWVKNSVIWPRLCSLPQPVIANTSPTATRASSGGNQVSFSVRDKRRFRRPTSVFLADMDDSSLALIRRSPRSVTVKPRVTDAIDRRIADMGRYDVIIIGTGAGGGTLAHRLAPTGKKILILERGTFVPREKQN